MLLLKRIRADCCKRGGQLNELTPVLSRPTMRVWIVSVPSKVWMDSMSAIFRRAHPTGKGLTAWSGRHTRRRPTGTPDTLTNVNSGKLVTPAGCGTADGTIIRQWAQLDNTCQQWDISP